MLWKVMAPSKAAFLNDAYSDSYHSCLLGCCPVYYMLWWLMLLHAIYSMRQSSLLNVWGVEKTRKYEFLGISLLCNSLTLSRTTLLSVVVIGMKHS